MFDFKDWKTVSIAGLLIVAGFWFCRREKPVLDRVDELPVNAPGATQGVQIQNSREPPAAPTKQSIEEARRDVNRELVLGLKRIPLVVKKKSLHFQIATRTEGRGCQVGDFDLLKSLAHSAREKLFILSIESLDGKGRGQSKRLGLAGMEASSPLTVELPLNSKLQFYGIFICAGGKDLKRCGNKAPMRDADWKRVASGARVFDKSTYFQMVATQNDEAYVLPNDHWDEAALLGLQKQLGHSGKLNPAFEKMRLLLSALGSLSATIGGKGLLIPLGYRGANCS